MGWGGTSRRAGLGGGLPLGADGLPAGGCRLVRPQTHSGSIPGDPLCGGWCGRKGQSGGLQVTGGIGGWLEPEV